MSLRYPYQPVQLTGPPGTVAAHPTGATQLWRPFVDVRIIGPSTSLLFSNALVDTGAQDTIFPWDTHHLIGAQLRPDTGHLLRWRGTAYPLRFADVELQLASRPSTWRWPAMVGLTKAPLPYVLLGYYGVLQFMNATFLGDQQALELETNPTYPGTKS